MAAAYRALAFFTWGIREFTKAGFERHAKNFTEGALDVDVSGRVYVVTGANSGIGYETSRAIYKKGGTVHLLCRNAERGEEAVQRLEKEGNGKLVLHKVDISKLDDIREFVQKFQQEGGKCDVLVNNAGCMVNERSETKDGLEVNFATNTLGTYYLTQLMIPMLAPEARVITVSSGGAYNMKLDDSDLQAEQGKFDGTTVYAQQKRQQIELTDYWAKKHPHLRFYSMHPGWAETPAVQTSMPSFANMMKGKLRSAEQGADTIVWLAISEEAKQIPSGSFVFDRQVAIKHFKLGFTQSTEEEVNGFVEKLDKLLSNLSK